MRKFEIPEKAWEDALKKSGPGKLLVAHLDYDMGTWRDSFFIPIQVGGAPTSRMTVAMGDPFPKSGTSYATVMYTNSAGEAVLKRHAGIRRRTQMYERSEARRFYDELRSKQNVLLQVFKIKQVVWIDP